MCAVTGFNRDYARRALKQALSLDFRSYAAAFSQARRRMLISVGVTGWGPGRRNCAAMITRRSLASMSATEGWALSRYQGASLRTAVTSSGW